MTRLAAAVRRRARGLALIGCVVALWVFGPGWFTAWTLWQGDRLVAANDFGDAETAYRRAFWFNVEPAITRLRLGELELRRQRPTPARAWFDAAALAEPTLGHLGVARSELRLGRPDGAQAQIDLAISAMRANSTGAATQAEVWRVAGEVALARAAADEAEYALALAVELAEILTPRPSWWGEATFRLGLLAARHDLIEADRRLAQVARAPGDRFADPAREALGTVSWLAADDAAYDRRVAVAELYVSRDLGWLAEPILTAAIVVQPADAWPRALLGSAHVQRANWTVAASHLEAAATLDDRSPLTWLLLGIANREIGELSPSARALERVIELDPHNPAGWRELARTYARAGAWPNAEQTMAQSVDVAPSRAEGLLALARFYLDHAFRAEAATRALREVVAFQPENRSAQAALGWALHLAGEREEALEHLRRVVGADQRNAEAWYYLGVMLDRQDDLVGAEQAWRLAVHHDQTGRYSQLADRAMAELRGFVVSP